MPKNITYEEFDQLKNQEGKLLNWDSDMETEGHLPPAKVCIYIEERDCIDAERKAQHNEFIADTRKMVGVYNCEKKKRDAQLAAKAKKKKELHQNFLAEKASSKKLNSPDSNSEVSSPSVAKASKTVALVVSESTKRKKTAASKKTKVPPQKWFNFYGQRINFFVQNCNGKSRTKVTRLGFAVRPH